MKNIAALEQIKRLEKELADARRQSREPEGGGPALNGLDAAAPWPDPDLAVLRLYRRPAPNFPLKVFGTEWGEWIVGTAGAASTPKDYVAHALLASVSVLIGNARWPQAGPGWAEPPHLWGGNVGDSGDGKSPAGDVLMRDVLPILEQKMAAEFPDRLVGT